MCDHTYDTTSRYDAAKKLLTFLLICPVCRSEQVVEIVEYEPNFTPSLAIEAGVGS